MITFNFDHFSLQVKYSVDYINLAKHDYLDFEDIQQKIIRSDGDNTNKRAASWEFDSIIIAWDLECPLGAPAFKDQCGL